MAHQLRKRESLVWEFWPHFYHTHVIVSQNSFVNQVCHHRRGDGLARAEDVLQTAKGVVHFPATVCVRLFTTEIDDQLAAYKSANLYEQWQTGYRPVLS